MTAAVGEQVPAEWYPDPYHPGQERLFDGVKWTTSTRRPRRRFAAPHAKRRPAIWLLVIGIILLFGVYTIPIGAGLIVWSVYLFRGEGENPAVAARRAQEQLAAEQRFRDAVDRLARVRTGATGFVNLRNLDAAAERAYGEHGPQASADALAWMGMDRNSLSSPLIGTLLSSGVGVLELYRDWVVLGQEAYDVDDHTRMSVFLDGGIQVVARPVQRGDRIVTVNEHHDTRRAEVQVVSDTWAIRASIAPDDVGRARVMADQLAAHIDRLNAESAADDMERIVDAILENTGQPAAEKLKQLSNLRFDRLLSDDEFQRAKERILRLDAGAAGSD